MGPEATAVVVSAAVTAAVGAVGAVGLAAAGSRRPSIVVFGAPLVMVVSLAAGVAAATRSMLVSADGYRTVIFVLLAGAPVALLVGLLLARRVRLIERTAAAGVATAERDRQVEQSRRDTVRWLSHDLQTPLTGIRLLAESVQERPDDPVGRARRIVAETDRMAGMVDDIAELSRLHGAPADGVREIIAISDLVSESVATVAPIADSDGVVIAAGRIADGDVLVDPDRMVRAVANLLRNAVQQSPSGTRVLVEADAIEGGGSGTVRISVTDQCGGLTTEDLEHIFDPGWRRDTARHERGMGLGTTIAREIARAHGGDVTISNLANGEGCLAILSLPTGARVPGGPQ
jgi:signal transduction histidine kinase